MTTITISLKVLEVIINIARLNTEVLDMCFDSAIMETVGASLGDVSDESNALDRAIKLGDVILIRVFAKDLAQIMRNADEGDLGKQWAEVASRLSEEAEHMRQALEPAPVVITDEMLCGAQHIAAAIS